MEKICVGHLNALEVIKNVVDVELEKVNKQIQEASKKYKLGGQSVAVDSDDDLLDDDLLDDDKDKCLKSIRQIVNASKYFENLQKEYEDNENYGKLSARIMNYKMSDDDDSSIEITDEEDLYG